jgi:hypothetical protein
MDSLNINKFQRKLPACSEQGCEVRNAVLRQLQALAVASYQGLLTYFGLSSFGEGSPFK